MDESRLIEIATTLDEGTFFDDRRAAAAIVAALVTTLRQRNAQTERLDKTYTTATRMAARRDRRNAG